VSGVVPTAEFAALVYGEQGVDLEDPAEAFHEASRLYPRVAPGRLAALMTLAQNPELQQTVTRSSRTFPQLPSVALPTGGIPRGSLETAVEARRSEAPGVRRSLALPLLASILETSYASSQRPGEGPRRPVPSGGALYPLEVYVLSLAVEHCEVAVYHYDPFQHCLERLASLDEGAACASLVDGQLVEHAASLLVVTAMFWRTRFKYGLRGYRFALLEAGHLAQNALLAAAALGVSALPIGGFYDRRLDALVGADGLDEASVYALVLGGAP